MSSQNEMKRVMRYLLKLAICLLVVVAGVNAYDDVESEFFFESTESPNEMPRLLVGGYYTAEFGIQVNLLFSTGALCSQWNTTAGYANQVGQIVVLATISGFAASNLAVFSHPPDVPKTVACALPRFKSSQFVLRNGFIYFLANSDADNSLELLNASTALPVIIAQTTQQLFNIAFSTTANVGTVKVTTSFSGTYCRSCSISIIVTVVIAIFVFL